MGKVGANKVIPGGERTLILRVLRFFEEEKRIGGPILPVNKVLKRTCAATGVSMATLTRIKREEKKILEELAATQPVSKKEAASSPATPTLSPTAALTTTMAGTPTTTTLKNQMSYSPRPVVTLPLLLLPRVGTSAELADG
ncbi:hypothetical protein O0L34_g10199 [Tuta absoluta]|nr:hypothetical protein O0L34_g10199 [Tuta absoluta]